MKPVKKILIVCTGNSCRSIMTEGYLVKRLEEIGMKDIIVISAGTAAMSGLGPTEESIQVMKEHNIDVSGYTSMRLTKEYIENANVILIMEPRHRDRILELVPEAKEKIYYLREFSSEKERQDILIEDPISRPVETYKEIFEVIKDSIEGFLKWLKE